MIMTSTVSRTVHTTVCILLILSVALSSPRAVRADCKEFKIVEYEDRVEAECVGEPLTEAQKKANLDEQRRQELEWKRQSAEEKNREKEAARAAKAQADAEAAERKKRDAKPDVKPVIPQPNRDPNRNSPIRF